MPLYDEFFESINHIKADAAALRDIVRGGPDVTVDIDGRSIDSVEKTLAELQQRITDASDSVLATVQQAASGIDEDAQAAQQALQAVQALRETVETLRDDAAAVVTGGTATIEPEAGKIPLARGDGTLDPAWIRDPLRHAVEGATGGRMTVLYDNAGNANHMHVLPRFRYEDLGFATELGTGVCTAFLVNGIEKSEIFIGAYQASSRSGKCVSQPARQPWANINYDESVSACAAIGAGWHLMTAHEWAAVAFWCMANGFQPRGNTDLLRAHNAPWETGRNAGQNLILSGSGPATWSHTDDYSGIADLVGNVWEWNHGLKSVDGEIFTTLDNNYSVADPNWPTSGKFLRNDLGSSPTLAETGSSNEGYQNVEWANTPTDAGYTSSRLLRRLLVEPAGIAPAGRLSARDGGVRFPLRGGTRGAGADAGLAALTTGNERGIRSPAVGFRPVYCP